MSKKTLKWLGPGFFGSDVAPGDDMPEVSKKRLEKFIKDGKVGSIAKAIDLEDIKSEKIKELEKENSYLKKGNDAEKVKTLEADLEELRKASVVLSEKNVEVEAENKELAEKVKTLEAKLKKK